MAIKQLSVYLENRPGTLAETVRYISDAKINIRAMSLADTTDFGILRLITTDVDKAEQLLSTKTIVKLTDVIAAKMDDKAGGIRVLLDALEHASVNIEYMYAFTAPNQSAYAVLRVDNVSLAEDVFKKNGIPTLQEGELQTLLEVQE